MQRTKIWDKVSCPKTSKGFINYDSSHFEAWDGLSAVVNSGKFKHYDCYFFPRGRVLYNCITEKTLVYADQKILDRIEIFKPILVDMYSLKDYVFCTDEHYQSKAKLK